MAVFGLVFPLIICYSIPNSLFLCIALSIVLAASVFAFGVLPHKTPVSINIYAFERILQYEYINCWGKQHTLKIDLTDPHGYYERERFTRYAGGMHLILYNGFNFYKRVSIKEDPVNGYNKEQLDEIVALMHQLK